MVNGAKASKDGCDELAMKSRQDRPVRHARIDHARIDQYSDPYTKLVLELAQLLVVPSITVNNYSITTLILTQDGL